MHELKCVHPFFDDAAMGRKTFEVRKHDRSFAQGDALHLREWDAASAKYTGHDALFIVTYCVPLTFLPGYVGMSIRRV